MLSCVCDLIEPDGSRGAAELVAKPIHGARQWQPGLLDLEDQSTFEPS